jgi:Phage endonuclease I/NUMOD3 motif
MPKKGYKQTAEHRAKLSAVRKGKPSTRKDWHPSDKQRAGQSRMMKGNLNMLGHAQSASTRALISSANKGKHGGPKSTEARARMSIAASKRLKANEHYRKNNGFRSAWEEKVAAWMTDRGWDWKYEQRAYVVGLHQYTPDFHVYAEGRLLKIVEVKGRWWPQARFKVEQFCRQYPELPFEIWDGPRLRAMGII